MSPLSSPSASECTHDLPTPLPTPTIRGVTREVSLDVEYGGRGKDPWGNLKSGAEATATIDRRDFGLVWNQALETGGILVGNDIRIEIQVQAVRAAVAA